MQKCEKCGYADMLGGDVTLVNQKWLCSICSHFAPHDNAAFENYLSEKIDHAHLESFRKHNLNKKDALKKAMHKTAKQGKIVSRPAFGYKLANNLLVPAENSDEVREIFEAFSNNASLNSIANAHNLSVNGVKKILKNFTYIGKVKFDNQILQGNHPSIISAELFNRVQSRFEQLSKSKED